MLHGAEVCGVNDAQLRAVRSAVKRVSTNSRNPVSTTAYFALHRVSQLDPSYRAHVVPILKWGQVIYQARFPLGSMHRIVRAAADDLRQAGARGKWRRVSSPAHAMIATAERIGWRILDARRFSDHTGVTRLFSELPGPRLKRLVEDGVDCWQWRQVGAREARRDRPITWDAHGFADESVWARLRKGVHYAPIRDLVNGKTTEVWDDDCQLGLRSSAQGGEWPQDRLYRAGFTTDNLCKWCGLEPGTEFHRCWMCPAIEHHRRQCLSEHAHLIDLARAASPDSNGVHPFWTRGWVSKAELAVPRMSGTQRHWIEREPTALPFTGPLRA